MTQYQGCLVLQARAELTWPLLLAQSVPLPLGSPWKVGSDSYCLPGAALLVHGTHSSS